MAAWFAVGVAMITAVIALSSANSAKTQAGAALKQASEAEKARRAAEAQVLEARNAVKAAEAGVEQAQRSAAAAEQQVSIMSEQVAAAKAERHERDTPQFTYEVQGSSGSVCPLKVTLDRGPSKLNVEVPWLGVRRAAEGNAGTFIERPKSGQIHQITTGGTFEIDIDTSGYNERMSATFDLRCTEPDTGRKWEFSHTVEIPGSYRVEDSVF